MAVCEALPGSGQRGVGGMNETVAVAAGDEGDKRVRRVVLGRYWDQVGVCEVARTFE